ncbi:VOC family protein [Actinomadura rubrisoli]|uniref:VOC family protein n=1 Tax=Actinomadura rubrisoli TaxID=2530368 RepID=A0A4R5CDK9_9ACTN|nr:VOC family protein [Actinomadura rubrisoli]TDD96333.1 VOC family protein [Actinomadura rubrisoli]
MKPSTGPAWLVLVSSEPSAAASFYRALLDWSFEETGDRGLRAARPGGDGFGEILDVGAPAVAGAPTDRWTVCFGVPALGPALEAASPWAPQVARPVSLDGRPGALVTDPRGAVFGLVESDRSPVRGAEGPFHYELATDDLPLAERFYSAVLGARIQPVKDDIFDFRSLSAPDGLTLGGMLDVREFHPSPIAPHWVPYFHVDDVDAEAMRAVELGGLMRIPPDSSPFDRYALLADPNGALFGLSDEHLRDAGRPRDVRDPGEPGRR